MVDNILLWLLSLTHTDPCDVGPNIDQLFEEILGEASTRMLSRARIIGWPSNLISLTRNLRLT